MSWLINPEMGLRILAKAKDLFAGIDSNGNPRYEYRLGGDGRDTDSDGIPEIDCSHLVYEALTREGYNVRYLTTAELNSDRAKRYFGEVPISDVREGDLIVFGNDRHVGIVESVWFDQNLGKYVGTFFHAEGFAAKPIISDFIYDPNGKNPDYRYGDERPITKFLRPKESIHNIMSYQEWFIIEHTNQLYGVTKKVQSPIALDLDEDGIETVNINEGGHFDHDANDFAEQTGWVGSGDGLLVYDRNNDGVIDTGRETFGNTTLLSDGTPADNGFQVLAELDENKDGKIDSQDAIWSSLKIWQDYDGDGYSSGDELWSLTDVGVSSINTGYNNSTYIDPQGNEHRQVGSFVRADGTTGQCFQVLIKIGNCQNNRQFLP